MPRPMSPPAMPPTAAPMATPLNAATIGPAAINGPTPGMASAPIPAIQPNAPTTAPPVTAPVTAPSGALVCFSCAKSWLVPLSANKAEMSLLEKFAFLSWSTMLSAWLREVAMQNTDFFDIIIFLSLVCFCLMLPELVIAAGGDLNFQLVVHIGGLGDPIRDVTDLTLFFGTVDRSAQGDLAVHGDDLDVFSVRGHAIGSDDFFANLRRGVNVRLAVALIHWRQRAVITITDVARRVVWFNGRIGIKVRLNFVGVINSCLLYTSP